MYMYIDTNIKQWLTAWRTRSVVDAAAPHRLAAVYRERVGRERLTNNHKLCDVLVTQICSKQSERATTGRHRLLMSSQPSGDSSH